MHSNESPFSPPASVREALAEAALRLNCYPDASSEELRNEIAQRLNEDCPDLALKGEQVIPTNGSEQAIRLLGDVYLDESTVCVCPSPTFPVYTTAFEHSGTRTALVPLTKASGADCDALLRTALAEGIELDDGANVSLLVAVDEATGQEGQTRYVDGEGVVVCLSTINNPTGGAVAKDAFMRLLKGLPSRALLVVDEAYFEFGREQGLDLNGLELLQRYCTCPWICLRTFAKVRDVGLQVVWPISLDIYGWEGWPDEVHV
eukprot:scaffold7222_cov535-Prasinococcus_capsulatus_cf.AAC.5